jgi:hypothetical protein
MAFTARRLTRPLLTIAFFAFAIYTLNQLLPLSSLVPSDNGSGARGATGSVVNGGRIKPGSDGPIRALEDEGFLGLVPLDAHLMSKCPDARDCLRDLILPVMQRVGSKVSYTSYFVGRPTDNDGVSCKHGPAECLGNIMMLCAADLYPKPETYLGYSMCMTRQYKDIPSRSLLEDCALEHALDFKKLDECASRDDGAYGMKLLRDSVTKSHQVSGSRCTVLRSCLGMGSGPHRQSDVHKLTCMAQSRWA